MESRVLVTLHGGGFVGGKPSWDGPQTDALKERGFRVLRVTFALDTLDAALASIRAAVAHLRRPRLVLGRSSGGFLAKVLLDEGVFDRAVYLAPVFRPLLRGVLVPALGAKAASYFAGYAAGGASTGTGAAADLSLLPKVIPSTEAWDATRETLVLAVKGTDENVPDELFTPEQLACALRPGPSTHASLIASTAPALLDTIFERLVGQR